MFPNNYKATLNKGISYEIRLLRSFIIFPVCTYIGQFVQMIYDIIYLKISTKNIKEFKD